jgi:hypothetical protein
MDETPADPAEPITPMSEEEADLFRFIRWGELPPRIHIRDTVAEVDTRTRRSDPPPDDFEHNRAS